jgi:hypothetical protein
VLQEALMEKHTALLAESEQQQLATKYGRSWLDYARKSNGCKICQRQFHTQKELDVFVQRFERVMCDLSIVCYTKRRAIDMT